MRSELIYFVKSSYYFTGDSLRAQNNRPFTTKDRDNGRSMIGDGSSSSNCAEEKQGAFWYRYGGSCAYANLNGEYLSNGTRSFTGVYWYDWKRSSSYSLKRVEMKIKPN